ncbi:MAG: transporter [Luteolibacter sp.]
MLSFSLSTTLVLSALLSSCVPSPEIEARRSMAADPRWPLVRAQAQRAVRHYEQQDFWAANACYTPYAFDGRTWVVRVSGAYPVQVWSDFVDLRVRNDGTVVELHAFRDPPVDGAWTLRRILQFRHNPKIWRERLVVRGEPEALSASPMHKRLLFLLPVLSSIVYAGPPLLTDDPDTPEQGHWEINIAATAEKRSGEWSLETPLLDFNYGLLDNVQLKFEIPYLIESEEGGSSHSGAGDAEFGVKWRFLDQDKCGISMSTYPQFAFNTASHSVHLGLVDDGWEFILPVEVQREICDGTTIFGEFGYVWTESEGNGLMWGLAVEQEIAEPFSLLAEIHGESADNFNDTEIIANLGFHWQATEHAALIGSVGRGLNESSEPQAKFLSYLGVQLTF